MTTAPLSSLQSYTLDAFTALALIRPKWAGQLVLSVGLHGRGASLPLAAHIAGAVSLIVDDDPARVREAARAGATDFVVNTLDEALRTIKNEIRKQTPLSVVLQASPGPALDEAVDRGLAPALFARFGGIGPSDAIARAAEYFNCLGAATVDFEAHPPTEPHPPAITVPSIAADALLRHAVSEKNWSRALFRPSSSAELRSFDRAALDMLDEHDTLRHRWLSRAPGLFARQRPPHRCLWLTGAEWEALGAQGLTVTIEPEA